MNGQTFSLNPCKWGKSQHQKTLICIQWFPAFTSPKDHPSPETTVSQFWAWSFIQGPTEFPTSMSKSALSSHSKQFTYTSHTTEKSAYLDLIHFTYWSLPHTLHILKKSLSTWICIPQTPFFYNRQSSFLIGQSCRLILYTYDQPSQQMTFHLQYE